MTRSISDFAVFGAAPRLENPIDTTQGNLPSPARIEKAFDGIFARRFFTNNGPLVKELDRRLAECLGVGDAICMTSGTVALMGMIAASSLKGEVIVPAFASAAAIFALSWAGVTPVLCDVNPDTHMIDTGEVRPLITARTSAILGIHLWGEACWSPELATLADKRGIKLVYDASRAMGCAVADRGIAQFGIASTFSFDDRNIVTCGEGGGVATDDRRLAAALRDIRNFYSSESGYYALRMNGKMSEAQAAFGLLGLDDLASNISANQARFMAYKEGLTGIPGIALRDHGNGSNFQDVMVVVDEEIACLSRDTLVRLLEAENVICNAPLHALPARFESIERSFPQAGRIRRSLMQLPSGRMVSAVMIGHICSLIRDMVALAPEIQGKWP